MGSIWLTWCLGDELKWVRAEIEGRDPSARSVRVADLDDVAGLASDLAGRGVAVAISASAGVDAVERALAGFGQVPDIESVLVLCKRADPGAVARWFAAGATEIAVAGGSAVAGERKTEVRAGEEPADVRAASPPACGACCDSALAGHVEAEAEGTAIAGEPGTMVLDGLDEPAGQGGLAGPRAPLIAVISGRGGCGKTTLVAAMATCAAHAGLRAAVLDFDLMFGNLPEVFGVEVFRGLEAVSEHMEGGHLAERDVESGAMRIGPGLTLWGPLSEPERAELMAPGAEGLVRLLRGIADVIFVDTPGSWGDAVAMAVAESDRCVVVGSGASCGASSKRAIELAGRLGVPRTRMTSVFNRFGGRGCGEEQAIAYEMGAALHSRARIADGGDEVSGMVSFGHLDELIAGQGSFAQSIQGFTRQMLLELGCPAGDWPEQQERPTRGGVRRLRLPWRDAAEVGR